MYTFRCIFYFLFLAFLIQLHLLIKKNNKLLARALANTLQKVIREVASQSQNAFTEGRQILDIIPIANEASGSRSKSLKLEMICKLDVEKDYDHVNWDSLLSILMGS